MTKTRIHAAIAAGLLAAGCSQLGAPTTAPSIAAAPLRVLAVEATSEGDDTALSASTTALEAQAFLDAQAEPSSTHNAYFRAAYLTDGNLHSAWRPAADDAAPSIVLRLASVQTLGAVGLKLEGDVTVDVAVATGDGAWTTVATGLAPEQRTFDTLGLDASASGDRVRLSFRGDASGLLVCEVKLFAARSASPAPSSAPSPGPSASPTASPSPGPSTAPSEAPSSEPSDAPSSAPSATPTPTPTAEPEACGKVTGGGTIRFAGKGNPRVTFGFVAISKNGPKGEIEVVDHRTKLKFHGTVTGVSCPEDGTVMFSGTLAGGAGTFTAIATDRGEPGRKDVFTFDTSTGFSVSGTLDGGNIQVHDD